MNVNMKVLNPSRKKLIPGDVFVLQVEEDQFVYGRVIRTDAKLVPPTRHVLGKTAYPDSEPGHLILIYVYSAFTQDKRIVPELDKCKLLIPPIMTNRLPWSRGYFETVEHRLLNDEDILQPHCFYSYSFRRYRDEYGHELPSRVEPCGEYGVHSFRTIDDAVSKALGIPPAPD